MSDNTIINLIGEIDEDTTGKVIQKILDINLEYDGSGIPVEEREPIKIYIQSCGGNCIDGLALIDIIKTSVTPIWGFALYAESMAAAIFVACDKRFMYENSHIMIHNTHHSVTGTICRVDSTIDFNKWVVDKLFSIFAEKSNMRKRDIIAKVKTSEWYVTPDECLKYGLTDVIMYPKKKR